MQSVTRIIWCFFLKIYANGVTNILGLAIVYKYKYLNRGFKKFWYRKICGT